MEITTKDNLDKEKSKDKENMFGQMVRFTKVSSRMES
jgi:hypothetical protein